MSAKIAGFVSRLAVHFPPPRFDSAEQEAEWLASIIASLRGYSDDVLERASQQIIDTRGLRAGEKWFPVPAEIRKVCVEIIDEDRRVPLLKQAFEEAHDGHKAPRASRARTKLVIDLLRGAMGQQAAREMWIGSLVDYVRDEKSLPPTNVVGVIKARARELELIRERCHAGVGWPSTPEGRAMARACAKLADTIEARNRLWSRVILGQEPEESLFKWIEKTEDLAGSVAA